MGPETSAFSHVLFSKGSKGVSSTSTEGNSAGGMLSVLEPRQCPGEDAGQSGCDAREEYEMTVCRHGTFLGSSRHNWEGF